MAKHFTQNGLLFQKYGQAVKLMGFADESDARTRLDIPSYITIFENGIFVETSVEVIHRQAFKKNQNLTMVVIPKTVQLIDTEAFCGCTNLTIVTAEFNLWKECSLNIMRRAFASCTNLRKFELFRPISWLYEEAFIDCPNLETINCTILDIAKNVFSPCKLGRLEFAKDCRIRKGAIENSGVKCVRFKGEIEHISPITVEWIRRDGIKILCPKNAVIVNWAYSGIQISCY